MKIEKEFIVGIKDLGMKNEMTNFAFLSFLEEIGCSHSDMAGYGINDIPITKKAWLLMDWKLQVIERPKYGDKLLVKTWGRPIEKHLFFTYRDFEVFSGDKKVAIATSKWVLFDTELQKISKITEEIYSSYKSENENVFEEKDILKHKDPERYDLKQVYEVKRADIDINKHMHNLNYLKLAYEVLPEEVYFDDEKKNVEIMYKHQILLGDKVNCYYTKEENKHVVTIKSEDDKVLHAIIELY